MMKLDQQFIARVRNPISRCWNYIGADAMEFCTSNYSAIEMCVDAGRLVDIANDREADTLITAMFKQYNYTKVMKFLVKNIKLL